MRNNRWIVLLVGLLAIGLLAAGCGDDDDSSSSTPTTSEEATTEEATTEDSGDSGDVEVEEVDADAFYDACTEAAAGTPGEATAETACAQARDALEQCSEDAAASGNAEVAQAAIEACQAAADEAVEQFEALG